MKKIPVLMLSLMLALGAGGCGNSNSNVTSESVDTVVSESESSSVTSTDESETSTEKAEETEGGKTLVVYYSATGNTEEAANYIASATDGDLFELEPVVPYTDDDLDYNDEDSRVVYEHEHPEDRNIELMESTIENWNEYDTVFIGYPIWWHAAAWPVDTFIKANDFTGKTVIPFCTSGSSGLEDSGELLKEMAGTGEWLEGTRFSSSVSEDDVQAFIESLE